MRRQAGKRKSSTSGDLVRENKAFLRRKSVRKSPRGGLQIIADRLNDLPDLRVLAAGKDCDPVEANAFAVWSLVETIVRSGSLLTAAELFNEAASQHPVRMVVDLNGENPHTAVSAQDDVGTALWHLWHFYFCDGGWERLKRCQIQDCSTWFVDVTKNKKMARCSKSCTDKWWNRPRRKEVKLKKDKKGGKSHGKKRR